MKKNTTKYVSCLVLAAAGVAALGLTLKPAGVLGTNAADLPCSWNHYAAVAPTETSSGNKEFWACCTHHEVSLTEPASGTVNEATNPNLDSVAAGTDYNDAYLSAVQNNKYNIGYAKMSKTGSTSGAWEHVSGYDDIRQSITVADFAAKDSFGSSAYAQKSTDEEGNSAKAGAWMLNFKSATLTMPKVDFTKYEYVKISYGIDTWNASSLAAWFGINEENDLHAQNAAKYGELSFVYGSGVLTVSDTVNSVTTSVTVSDADIINGNKSLVMKGGCVDGERTMYINDIYLKTADHVHGTASYVAASDRFGRKTATCTCGETLYAPGDDVIMGFTSPSQFGASGSFMSAYETGKWEETAPSVGAIAYAVGNPDPVTSITLPRIDFKSSGTTVIKFGTNQTSGTAETQRVGLSYGGVTIIDRATNHGDYPEIALVATYDAVSGNVTLQSSLSDGTVYGTSTVTNASVISGDANLVLDADIAETNYIALGLNAIYCNHTHTNETVAGGDHIEYNYDHCTVCGAYKQQSELATSVQLTSVNQFGMNAAGICSADGRYGKAGSMMFNGSCSGTTNHFQFPKTNYKAFGSVTYAIGIDTYNQESLYCNLKIGDTYLIGADDVKNVYGDGTIVVTASGDELSVTINLSNSATGAVISTNTVVVTDADIASGNSSLVIIRVNESSRTLYLDPTVTLTAK